MDLNWSSPSLPPSPPCGQKHVFVRELDVARGEIGDKGTARKRKTASSAVTPCPRHVLTTQAHALACSLGREGSLGTSGSVTAMSRKACPCLTDTMGQSSQQKQDKSNRQEGEKSGCSVAPRKSTLGIPLGILLCFSQSAAGKQEQMKTLDSHKSHPTHFHKMTVVSFL